jgi:hypothetical protein
VEIVKLAHWILPEHRSGTAFPIPGNRSAPPANRPRPQRKDVSGHVARSTFCICPAWSHMLESGLGVLGPMLTGEYQTASFVVTHPAFRRRNKPGAGSKKTFLYASVGRDQLSKGLCGSETESANLPASLAFWHWATRSQKIYRCGGDRRAAVLITAMGPAFHCYQMTTHVRARARSGRHNRPCARQTDAEPQGH